MKQLSNCQREKMQQFSNGHETYRLVLLQPRGKHKKCNKAVVVNSFLHHIYYKTSHKLYLSVPTDEEENCDICCD